MEQLNIEGKRSGEGFVCHRESLCAALARAVAPIVRIGETELGRKGFLSYLRLLGGGMVKVVPAVAASVAQGNGSQGLKVVCGSHSSIVPNHEWVKEGTPAIMVEVRVSPSVAVNPNLGTMELAEALTRVIPFAAGKSEEGRPILKCILFTKSEGSLTIASADGFALAEITVPMETRGEAKALIPADELKAVIPALRRAKRVKVRFDKAEADTYHNLTLETELIAYTWVSERGQYPSFQGLVPAEVKGMARFDAREVLRQAQAIALLQGDPTSTVKLYIEGGSLRLEPNEGEGEAVIEAEAEGEARTAIAGSYLAQALKALGGMAEVVVGTSKEPIIFNSNGYQLNIMPMFVAWADEEQPTPAEVEEQPAEVEEQPAEVEEQPVA